MAILIDENYKYEMSFSLNQRVKSAQFGQGYKQISADGLNPNSESWGVTFIFKTLEEGQTFLQTLRDNAGKPVYWIPPNSTYPSLWTIESIQGSIMSPLYSEVSVTMQSFNGAA